VPKQQPLPHQQEALQDEETQQTPIEQLLSAPDVGPDLWPPSDLWTSDAAALIHGSSSGAAIDDRSGSSSLGQSGAVVLMAWVPGAAGKRSGIKRSGASGNGSGRLGASFRQHGSSGRLGLGWARGPSLGGAAGRSSFAERQSAAPNELLSTQGAAGRSKKWTEEQLWQRPVRIGVTAQALLTFVKTAIQRLHLYHPLLHAPVCAALLDGLAAMLKAGSALLAVPAAGEQQPAAPDALLLHAAQAQCVHRQLLAMRPLVQALVAGSNTASNPDSNTTVEQQLQQRHATLLGRATSLAQSLQQALGSLHCRLLETVVGAALEATPWSDPRRPIKGADGSGPAARMWRVQLTGLMHSARQALAPGQAVQIVSEVMLQSLSNTLAPRYLAAAPSPARLSGYCADIAVVCTTAWSFCQPLNLSDNSSGSGGGGAAQASSTGEGGESLTGQTTLLGTTARNAWGADEQEAALVVAVSPAVSQQVSDICLSLCMRASRLPEQQGQEQGQQGASAAAPTLNSGSHQSTQQQQQQQQQQQSPWRSWLAPGLLILLQTQEPIWLPAAPRWPFDPADHAKVGTGDADQDSSAVVALWLESAQRVPREQQQQVAVVVQGVTDD